MTKKTTKRRKTKNRISQKPDIITNEDFFRYKGMIVKIGMILFIPFAAYLLFSAKDGQKQLTNRQATRRISNKPLTEPQFKKEGELIFLQQKSKKAIKKIDIEIAEKPLERQQGLMYRTSMPDSVGMLFIFGQAKLQSFWMKDTYISLDILFVSETNEIVTIHRNAKPQSEDSIFSYKNSKYVVEVIGGFCDRFGIKEGDSIRFKKQ